MAYPVSSKLFEFWRGRIHDQ